MAIAFPPTTIHGVAVRVLDYADTNCGPTPVVLSLVGDNMQFGSADPVTGISTDGDTEFNLQTTP